MRIGCITRHPYPTAQEVRVTKFADTLYSRGHDFFVLCPGDETQESLDSFKYGQIIRLITCERRFLGSFMYKPLPINPIWMCWFFRQFRNHALDIVIVRDLRLALPVFLAARACGIGAILDLGEHYPGMMEILGKQNPAHYIIRNRWLIARLEALSVRMADCVWVVAEENKERLQRNSSRINVINNYPVPIGKEVVQKVLPRAYSNTEEPVTLIFLGVIDNFRGLELAVDALAILVRELGNVRLKIYGDGLFRDALEKQVKLLELENKVVFGGWVSASQKYEVMAEGDIGLILHKVCDLTQHTIPNKLFDYMSVGLPVVSTKLGPVVRILDAEQCGIAVDENAEAVAEEVKALILDVKRRKRFAENGYRAVRSRYRWDQEEEKIIGDINALTANAT